MLQKLQVGLQKNPDQIKSKWFLDNIVQMQCAGIYAHVCVQYVCVWVLGVYLQ